jgi:hypothetical protein
MDIAEFRDLEAELGRLRSSFANINRLNAGVAVLHLEATIAALESHLRKAARMMRPRRQPSELLSG